MVSKNTLDDMITRRTYDDRCGAAHALDIVGERWALLIVRELLLGPKRFTDLRAGLPCASPNVLTQRLRELEQAGVVRRRKLGPPTGSRVYELTSWGLELEPVILQMVRWGLRSPSWSSDPPIGIDSMVLALRTMFDPNAADGLTASYELRLGDDCFRAVVTDGQIELARGSAGQPDAIIETDPATLAALVFGSRQLTQALESRELKLRGDRSAVERFLSLFSLPESASSESGA